MSKTASQRVYQIAFDLLEKNPEGIQWTDLNRRIKEADPSLHPKTINGYVWKMMEKYPKDVYKPEKGLFRLTKYKGKDN